MLRSRTTLTRRAFLRQAVAFASAAGLGLVGPLPPELGARAARPGRRDVVPFEPYLRARAAWGGSFSADGSRLAFLSDESGLAQVWQLDLPTGQLSQLTFGPERATFASFPRTGRGLIFGSDVGGDEHVQLSWLAPDGTSRPLTEQPDVIHRFGGWSPDGRRIAFSANRRHQAHFDVYVQEVPAGEARLVLERDGMNVPVEWSPDGGALIVSQEHSASDSDLHLLDLADGSLRHLTPHSREAVYGAVEWAPDSRYLYLVTDQDRDRAVLARLDLADGSLAAMIESAWEAETCRLWRDGRRLAWQTNQDGYSSLRVRDLASGHDLPLPELPSGVIEHLRWAPDGRRLVLTLNAFDETTDLWLVVLDPPAALRLTRSSRGGLPADAFVAPELMHYPSFDGLEIPAFLLPPRGRTGEGPPPVLVSVHGGPEAQARPGLSPTAQYFSQRGYAVFVPNVRGSSGYGRRYTHLDDVDRRLDAVADLEAGRRWLVEQGLADPGRVAVLGGSYGGFMVLAALVTYPDSWAAGVDIAGIANFVTFLEGTAAYRRALREAEYGSLERDAALLREISPIHQVDRIQAPLMVVHGANDPRVPISEAEQIVAALQARGSPVEYLRFEDEGHGLARLENRLIAYPAMAEFLDHALGLSGDESSRPLTADR